VSPADAQYFEVLDGCAGATYLHSLSSISVSGQKGDLVDGKWGFWIGLAAAIPLSVLGNILTPYAAKAPGALGRAIGRRNRARINEEESAARWYVDNPNDLVHYVLWLTCRALYNIASMISGSAVLIVSVDKAGASSAIVPALIMVVLLSSLLLGSRINRATRIAQAIRRIRNSPRLV